MIFLSYDNRLVDQIIVFISVIICPFHKSYFYFI